MPRTSDSPSIYSPDILGLGMEIFDSLPRVIRDRLNDGTVTQKVEDMHVIARVLRMRGEDHVIGLLAAADRQRQDGKL